MTEPRGTGTVEGVGPVAVGSVIVRMVSGGGGTLQPKHYEDGGEGLCSGDSDHGRCEPVAKPLQGADEHHTGSLYTGLGSLMFRPESSSSLILAMSSASISLFSRRRASVSSIASAAC